MKIALVQLRCKPGDVANNLTRIEQHVATAAGNGADVVVFPEMSDTGYDMPAIARTAAPADGEPRRAISELARRHRIWIVAGLSLREGGRIFNTAVAFSRGGETVSEYRKIHLFGGMQDPEHEYLTAGDRRLTFDLDGLRVGLMICYDLRFPELARSLVVVDGAEAIFLPSAWPSPRIAHFPALCIARALENQCYFLGINRSGNDGGLPFGGASIAVDPLGTRLCDAEQDETVLYADIDRRAVLEAREKFVWLRDRRPEKY